MGLFDIEVMLSAFGGGDPRSGINKTPGYAPTCEVLAQDGLLILKPGFNPLPTDRGERYLDALLKVRA